MKQGEVEEALRIRDDMVGHGIWVNHVTYNALFGGLCKVCKTDKAKDLLREMIEMGIKLDVWTYNSLIQGYYREHNTVEMKKRNMTPTVFTCIVIINGLCLCGALERAKDILEIMVGEGLKPNAITYTLLKVTPVKVELKNQKQF